MAKSKSREFPLPRGGGVAFLAAALCGLASLRAQDSDAKPAQEPLTELVYHESRSLALFAACDRNLDERLDVFEVGAAFVDLEDPRDPSMFRRIDTDASGYIEWPEFDARFLRAIDRVGQLRLRPVHPIADVRDPTIPPPPVDPTEQILGRFDIDHDGMLSAEEFKSFVRRAELDANVVERLPVLDTNGDGMLDVPELAPVIQAIPSIWHRLAPHEREIRAMPAEFRAIDVNLDGAIARTELEVGLARIHPSLALWVQRVLADADRSRDAMLGPSELSTALNSARERAAPK